MGEDSVPREEGYSCALSEEKPVTGTKAGGFISTISMMHRTNNLSKQVTTRASDTALQTATLGPYCAFLKSSCQVN